ncbi:hypothetical protein CSUB01_09928 [Colletotrichum sublineola]|uniref:Uncharacterized protein n=1 Tax=Colletotrichum sublineola TaxID=1173701 RepID=A0A066WYD6_COLSU|nr:hypothetical protein CSUB01_09928 [Colletotrichum sublineola]
MIPAHNVALPWCRWLGRAKAGSSDKAQATRTFGAILAAHHPFEFGLAAQARRTWEGNLMSDPFATKVPFDASTEKMMNDFPPPPDEPDPVVPKELRAKRVVPSPRKAPTVRSGKGSIFGKASIPSVYWAGDDPTPMNNDEFTFYREGTPPPESEKGSMSRAWAYRQSVFDHEDSERGRRRRCCGMKRWLFWLLVGLVFLIAMGVGIGVGVGVGADAGKHASQSDQSAETGDKTQPLVDSYRDDSAVSDETPDRSDGDFKLVDDQGLNDVRDSFTDDQYHAGRVDNQLDLDNVDQDSGVPHSDFRPQLHLPGG